MVWLEEGTDDTGNIHEQNDLFIHLRAANHRPIRYLFFEVSDQNQIIMKDSDEKFIMRTIES